MKKRPKIAVLVPRFGIVERGAENFTREFVEYLSPDFEIEIFSRASGRGVKKIWAVGESTRFLQFIYNLNPAFKKVLDKFYLTPVDFEMLTFSIACLPHLLFGKYDLLFPGNGVWGAIVSRTIRFLRGIPYIYRSAGGFEPQIVRQRPSVYVATTPETADKIKKYSRDTKVVIIPNGVNTNKFSPKVKSAYLNLQKPIFVCACALIPQKKVDLAIRAVARLKKGSLLVLGGGLFYDELMGLGKKFLGSRRFLIKSVSHSLMPSYLRAGDVFTLPSLGEPFGNVYLEAMACGLSVVASWDANRKFIIGQAGVLCDVENIEEYSKTLFKVSRKKWGSLPRQQAMKFSWDKVAKEYKKLLQKIN